MSEKILILGGTKEANQLAADLVALDHDVTTSLAGRTREPKPVTGKTRIGGFGGADNMAQYIRTEGFNSVIDATHPFATQISINAIKATELAGVALSIRTRPPWNKQEGDLWLEVTSLEEAAILIPKNARILLALGSQHIAPFQYRDDVHFLVRTVDKPTQPLPFRNATSLIGLPSLDWHSEAAVLREHGIDHILSRNSGGTGAYAKIEAARHLKLNVIMIQRPELKPL